MSESLQSKIVELPVEIRKAGKGPARALRSRKFTPAVVYGHGFKNVEIAIDERLIEKYSVLGLDNHIFKLNDSEGVLKGRHVILKSLERHPVSRQFVHVDMQIVEPGKPFRKDVRVDYQGTAAGVKEGGAFQVARRRVRIECLPENLPQTIVVDVSGLGLKQKVSVADLNLPEGVQVITRPEVTLCTCAK